MGEVILVPGGARSGKMRLAERLAGGFPSVAYVATALHRPEDSERTGRIVRHLQGFGDQAPAGASDAADLCVAGLPVRLK